MAFSGVPFDSRLVLHGIAVAACLCFETRELGVAALGVNILAIRRASHQLQHHDKSRGNGDLVVVFLINVDRIHQGPNTVKR
jgi:hypothetical protein